MVHAKSRLIAGCLQIKEFGVVGEIDGMRLIALVLLYDLQLPKTEGASLAYTKKGQNCQIQISTDNPFTCMARENEKKNITPEMYTQARSMVLSNAIVSKRNDCQPELILFKSLHMYTKNISNPSPTQEELDSLNVKTLYYFWNNPHTKNYNGVKKYVLNIFNDNNSVQKGQRLVSILRTQNGMMHYRQSKNFNETPHSAKSTGPPSKKPSKKRQSSKIFENEKKKHQKRQGGKSGKEIGEGSAAGDEVLT